MLEFLQRLEIAMELDRQRQLAAKLKAQKKDLKIRPDTQPNAKRG